MIATRKTRIDWNNIDTVLLDMDGTLIDLHHEEAFWSSIVPKAYAKKHGIQLEEAKKIVFEMYAAKYGTLDWNSVEHWEKQLGVELWDLRDEVKHLVKLHPHTIRFLKFLKKRGKSVYLVTDAPRKSADFELAHTKISGYFDGVYTAFMLGATKHDIAFWKSLEKKIKFDKERTLLAEDGKESLNAARKFGIRWLIFKSKPYSKKPAGILEGFTPVRHFDDII